MHLSRLVLTGAVAGALVLPAVVLAPGALGEGGRGAPVVGSPSGEDPYFPKDGNGGYDALHYRIRDTYRPGVDVLRGTTTLRARARADLAAFHLDLALRPTSARVDGRPARLVKVDRHTVRIRPRQALARGDVFVVRVAYRGRPSTTRAAGMDSPFTHIRGEGVAMGEPQNAPWWFAANETPSDKATYDITIRVPRGREAISNGELVSRTVGARWTRWRWRMDRPMSTYLAFFVAGDLRVERSKVGDRPSLVAVSRQLPRGVRTQWLTALRRSGSIVRWLERQFGPYPFDSTGGVAVAAGDDYALETQSRPVYPGDYSPETWLLVHELAHQWFGDSVSVRRWRDIWLNEGFATYAEWLWAEKRQGFPVAQQLRETYETRWAGSSFWRLKVSDPGPEAVFADAVYERGAMTLAALRNRIGTGAFDRLLRRWVREHRYGTATTAQFRALAEKVSGDRRLDAFFTAWLEATERPQDTAANGLGALSP